MRSCKTFVALVFCCGFAVGYGLLGCGGDGDDGRPGCNDKDGDGYGNPSSRSCVNLGLDCNDSDADVYPGAPELCDGIDNQCPGDLGHAIVDNDAVCLCSFDGGSFLFTVGDAEDNCAGIDIASLFPQGAQVGPVALPGFQDLPATIQIPFAPPIDTVSVSVFSGGDDIRIASTEPTQVTLPEVGSVSATVDGAFCPGLQGQMLATFTIHLTSPISCNVEIEATGAPAGG